MPALIVTNNLEDWPFEVPGAEVADAQSYLTQPEYARRRNVKLFNLCRSYAYQSTGYYVSLLAEARGHKPLPSVMTLQDMATPSLVQLASEELEEAIQHSFAPLQSKEFTLSVYFGRNLAKRYEVLSRKLFNIFESPLLRFRFARGEDGWELKKVKTISASDVPESHRPFVLEAATRHFAGRAVSRGKEVRYSYDLAILHDPEEHENAPSDEKALKKFVKAGESLGLSVELITRDEYGRLSEFDGLFIRQTTQVNHYTYRFSRRAAREGLVVIDDPVSIARCTNKVYLAELLEHHGVPAPKTLVVHRENIDRVEELIGWPCVLKKPDGSFSQGVVKVHNAEELKTQLTAFFKESELVVAQEFLPTDFDWRIGILNRRPLYACKYHMAKGHWQIIQQERTGAGRYGKSETLPVEMAPRRAVQVALKAANLVGDGLYGVDIKQSGGQFHVIEVNDNPNIDAGVEDQILRDDLYRRIMEVFLERIDLRKARNFRQ
ncbi:MAG: RimK family protein [Planctomycetaceae bacterium]|nr:RimK family protein [Planctomycetaceae bacterium]